MSYITTMPKGLIYSVKQTNGQQEATLDMHKTAVSVIPAMLQGVDCVVVTTGQLRYVAPDYRGKIIVCHGPLGKEKTIMSKNDIQNLKISYQRALGNYSSLFFEISTLNAQGQEQNLPAKLAFNKKQRILDARQTVLTSSHVQGILGTMMPDKYLQDNENKMRHVAKIEDKERFKDYGKVKELFGGYRHRSITHGSRFV